MALDPGVTTGYAIGSLTELASPCSYEFSLELNGQAKLSTRQLQLTLSSIAPDIVIAEAFDYRNRARSGLELYSRNLLGVTEAWCESSNTKLTEPSAGYGLGFFDNAKLERLGIYRAGLPHAMDATRHLLQWMQYGEGRKYVGKQWHWSKDLQHA